MRHRCFRLATFAGLMVAATTVSANELTFLGSFDPVDPTAAPNVVQIAGMGYRNVDDDGPGADTVHIFGEGRSRVFDYAASQAVDPGPGMGLEQDFFRRGEVSATGDVSFSSVDLTLDGSSIDRSNAIVFQSNSFSSRIVAFDPETENAGAGGLAGVSLSQALGTIVGGSYHVQRETFFVMSDTGIITEVGTDGVATGNSFSINAVGTTPVVAFTDGDVEALDFNGNLWIVSEGNEFIRVLDPTGGFVQDIVLPGEVDATDLNSLAFDQANGELWLGSNGVAYNLGNVQAVAVPEPGTFALLGGLSVAGLARRRVRRRRVAV